MVLGLVLISFAKPLLGLFLSIVLIALLIRFRSKRSTDPFKDFKMTETKLEKDFKMTKIKQEDE